VNSVWDKFVNYTRNDLERFKLLSPGGFLNETMFLRFLGGASWQQQERIFDLEQRVSRIEGDQQ